MLDRFKNILSFIIIFSICISCSETKVLKDFGCGKKHHISKKTGNKDKDEIIDESPNEENSKEEKDPKKKDLFNKLSKDFDKEIKKEDEEDFS